MAHNARGWTTYVPTETTMLGATIALKCDAQTSANNPGSPFTLVPSIYDFWPLHDADLRYVRGFDTAAPQYKDRCTNMNPTNGLYTLGAVFLDFSGNSYTVNGLHSEVFKISHLK